MAGETKVTVIGNLTADPELRFTPSGSAVANFTIASTPRVFDRQANEWKDGEPLFIRGSVWREAAENAAHTLAKGMRVIAYGDLQVRSYENQQGQRGISVEMNVEEIGPSLRFASATVTRSQGGQGGGGYTQQGGQQQGGNYGGQQQHQQQAPQGGQGGPGGAWGNNPPQQQQQAPQQQQGGGNGGWGNPGTNEPPF